MNQKLKAYFVIVIISMTTVVSISFTKKVKGKNYLFTIEAKIEVGNDHSDYIWLLKQYLARIGINVEIVMCDVTGINPWIFRLNWIDFDMSYAELDSCWVDPDMTGFYNENGSLNIFGYNTSLDYNQTLGTGLNEWYMQQGNLMMPPTSEERIQHYWAWEQYLMDKICPLVPTFVPKEYSASWSNLQGYNASKGIIQSWGDMYWKGSHQGQKSTNELVISAYYSHPKTIYRKGVMEPLIWFDSDKTSYPHLAKNINYLNNTHVRINCREGIKWQPDPEGMFKDEEFDVEDVYFSLFYWSQLSEESKYWYWLEDLKIIDQNTIDLFIDKDPDSPENEPFPQYLWYLQNPILPEHYLNQSQTEDGKTPDMNHSSWDIFTSNCFGTGPFQLTDYQEDVEATFGIFNESWWLNNSMTNDPTLNWEDRFGSFTTEELDTLRISFQKVFLGEFEKGRIDIIDLPESYTSQHNQYAKNPNFTIHYSLKEHFSFYCFNLREEGYLGSREPCPNNPNMTKGLAIRKAIAYAINRKEINNIVHHGKRIINNWPICMNLRAWCNPNIIRYDYNLTKALEYMTMAGFAISSYNQTTLWTSIIGLPYFTGIVISLITFVVLGTRVIKKSKEKTKKV